MELESIVPFPQSFGGDVAIYNQVIQQWIASSGKGTLLARTEE
jgi:hypothetical protein